MNDEDWQNIYKIGRHLWGVTPPETGLAQMRNTALMKRMYHWRYRYDKKKTNGVPTAERHRFVKGAEELGIELTHKNFREWDKR